MYDLFEVGSSPKQANFFWKKIDGEFQMSNLKTQELDLKVLKNCKE